MFFFRKMYTKALKKSVENPDPITVKLNGIPFMILQHIIMQGLILLPAWWKDRAIFKQQRTIALILLTCAAIFGLFILILKKLWQGMPALTFLWLKTAYGILMYMSPGILVVAGLILHAPIGISLAFLPWPIITGWDLWKKALTYEKQLKHHARINMLNNAYSLRQRVVYEKPLIILDREETKKRNKHQNDTYGGLMLLSAILFGVLLKLLEDFDLIYFINIFLLYGSGFVFEASLARTLALLFYLKEKQEDNQQPFVIRKSTPESTKMTQDVQRRTELSKNLDK
jgi:hypothetical protein